MRDTRNGHAVRVKEDSGDPPGVWSAYGRLLQLMPAGPGFHTGLNGPFVVLETKEHRHIGYVESQEVGCVVRDPAEVSAFGPRYGKLRSQALNVMESARLIGRLLGET
ncbi:Scr1 family TA system antitoxin-like transcriptional regulator [Streptomyces pini]|uniref:Scr1 family TA system antitoxin-like transcriptional regulator n=1 Tax=Streptomyces pini TaxID=1520580 RepID=UPI001587B852